MDFLFFGPPIRNTVLFSTFFAAVSYLEKTRLPKMAALCFAVTIQPNVTCPIRNQWAQLFELIPRLHTTLKARCSMFQLTRRHILFGSLFLFSSFLVAQGPP